MYLNLNLNLKKKKKKKKKKRKRKKGNVCIVRSIDVLHVAHPHTPLTRHDFFIIYTGIPLGPFLEWNEVPILISNIDLKYMFMIIKKTNKKKNNTDLCSPHT